MIILFSGHRDKTSTEVQLDFVKDSYPNATWIHGGAIGFDSQVEEYAREHGIETKVYKPDYESNGLSAPLVRNSAMVRDCDLLAVLYDGRIRGGTYDTLRKAKRANKPIVYLAP